MGRLPTLSVLGLSIMSLSTMVYYIVIVRAPQDLFADPHDTSLAGLILSFFGGAVGLTLYLCGLREEVAIKSATYGFVGANLGLAGVYLWVESAMAFELVLAALFPGYVGLIAAVLLHDGTVEPQKEAPQTQSSQKS